MRLERDRPVVLVRGKSRHARDSLAGVGNEFRRADYGLIRNWLAAGVVPSRSS